jgi:hypothetical protein
MKRAASGVSVHLRQLSQRLVNLDLEHHRRDPLLDHRLLKQIRQVTFLFGVEVVVDIVDVR